MKNGVERKYYKNGNIKKESYYLNDKHHRENGPAVIWYYKNKSIEVEEYFINGEYHREDGSAYIYYKSLSLLLLLHQNQHQDYLMFLWLLPNHQY